MKINIPQWIHRLGSPPEFYKFSSRYAPMFMVLGIILLCVAWVWGLMFTPEDAKQGNSFRIIYLHVPVSFMALAGYYVMAFSGVVLLVWKIKLMGLMLRSSAIIGAVMTFIALFTGAVWGKPTWGTWWEWDARVTSMLVLFFLYVGVIVLINSFSQFSSGKEKGYDIASIFALVGTVNVPIIYKSVDWWFSLHQPATIKFLEAPTISPTMRTPLFIAIAAIYIFYFGVLFWQTSVLLIDRDYKKAWFKKTMEGQ
jgi:heme exporter protein C